MYMHLNELCRVPLKAKVQTFEAGKLFIVVTYLYGYMLGCCGNQAITYFSVHKPTSLQLRTF